MTPQIQKISKLIVSTVLVELGGKDVTERLAKLQSSLEKLLKFIEESPKPELLSESKGYNQMEMEMDKFLAKKSQIYHKNVFQLFSRNEQHDNFHIYKAILHLTLKSFYENLRKHKLLCLSSANQIYLDAFYLYASCCLIPFFIFTK